MNANLGWALYYDLIPPSFEFTSIHTIKVLKIIENSVFFQSLPQHLIILGTKTGEIIFCSITNHDTQHPHIIFLAIVQVHNSSITSFSNTNSVDTRNLNTIACLSKDGSFSLISYTNFDSLIYQEALFPPDSHSLSYHPSIPSVYIAVSNQGVIAYNVFQREEVLFIPSTNINHMLSVSGFHFLSYTDNSFSFIALGNEAPAIILFSKAYQNTDILRIIPSPTLSFSLLMKESSLIVTDGQNNSEELSFHKITDAKWISHTHFYVITNENLLFVYNVESKRQSSILLNYESVQEDFDTISNFTEIIIQSPLITNIEKHKALISLSLIKKMKLKKHSLLNVTDNFDIIAAGSPDEPSSLFLYCNNESEETKYSMNSIFSNKIISRKLFASNGIMELTNTFDILLNGTKIGHHENAQHIVAPKNGYCLYSCQRKEILQWNQEGISTNIHGMLEDITNVISCPETVCFIGTLTFMIVGKTQHICGKHDSKILSLTYSNSLYHAECESGRTFSWSGQGKLVSLHSSEDNCFPKPTKNSISTVVLPNDVEIPIFCQDPDNKPPLFTSNYSPIIIGDNSITIPLVQSDVFHQTSKQTSLAIVNGFEFPDSKDFCKPCYLTFASLLETKFREKSVNAIKKCMCNLPISHSQEILNNISLIFKDKYDIIFTFLFIHCLSHPAPPQLFQKYSNELIHSLLSNKDLLFLFCEASCTLHSFIPISVIEHLFSSLTEDQIIEIADKSPDLFMKYYSTKKDTILFMNVLKKSFQKSRVFLLHIVHICSRENFSDLLALIPKINPCVALSKSFIYVCDGNGAILRISRATHNIDMGLQVSDMPISLISLSPKEIKMIAIQPDKKLLFWINTKTFKIIKTEIYQIDARPNLLTWKNDDTFSFNLNDQILETYSL